MKRLLLTIVVLLLYFGCKTDSSKNNLQHILRAYEPSIQIFKVNPDSLIELKGQKGTILKIDPTVLQNQDGSSVMGSIEIRLMELTSTEDLLRANAQTVSDDRWLISGGAYKIEIFSKNKELKIADGKNIEVNFPKIAPETMQLFEGTRELEGNINWKLLNRNLNVRRYPVVIRKDSSFMRFNRQFQIDMPIDSLVYSQLKEKFSAKGLFEKYPELDSIAIKNDTIFGIRFRRIMSETIPTDSIPNSEILYDSVTGKFLNTNPRIDLMDDLYETISISKLGWINVDRFYPEIKNRVRFEITSNIKVDYAQLYAADTENNTLLNLYEDEKGVASFDAPRGKRFTIIAFGVKGEQTYGYKKSILIEKSTRHQIKYRKADNNKMKDYFKLD